MKKVFSFWRIIIAVALTKSLWTITTEKEERTVIVAMNFVQKDDNLALEIFLGPLSIVIGLV